MVFGDSSPVNQQKYFPLLEQTATHQPVYYVGPREKEQFLAYLNGRLRDRRLETLVRNLFRPSYGGNRNFTLMYTLGDLLISSDDDMRLTLWSNTVPSRWIPTKSAAGACTTPATTGTRGNPSTLWRRSSMFWENLPRRCPTTTNAASC